MSDMYPEPEHVVAARPQGYQPYNAAEPAGTDHAAPWTKLPGGPVDLSTGQLTGEDFPDSAPWVQC